jgi:uncharacterized phage protein (TIGR01671 family)
VRKIKFRMWDTLEKNFMNHSRVIESRILALENNGEERFIFQQWTGLFDRHGKEIYEGDILKIDDDWEKWGFASGFVGYVIYDQGSFKLKEGEIYDPAYRLDSAAEEGTTVIGNIFQDGDLLRDS